MRLMVMGGCFPVRGSKGMECKYDDYLCVCVGPKKQRYMCFSSVNAMIRRAEDGRGHGMGWIRRKGLI